MSGMGWVGGCRWLRIRLGPSVATLVGDSNAMLSHVCTRRNGQANMSARTFLMSSSVVEQCSSVVLPFRHRSPWEPNG